MEVEGVSVLFLDYETMKKKNLGILCFMEFVLLGFGCILLRSFISTLLIQAVSNFEDRDSNGWLACRLKVCLLSGRGSL